MAFYLPAGALELVQPGEVGVAMGADVVSHVDVSFAVWANSHSCLRTGIPNGCGGGSLGCQDRLSDLLRRESLGIEFAKNGNHNGTICGRGPVRDRNAHRSLTNGTFAGFSCTGLLGGQAVPVRAN